MKIKEDIIKWRNEIRELSQQVVSLENNSKNYLAEIGALKEQVKKLAEITEEMTETMLSLIRQQIGD